MFQEKSVGFGQRVAMGVSLAGVSVLSFADTSAYDVSTLTAAAADAATAVLAIGAAVVAGPKIAVKVWKWIGRAL